MPAFIPGMGQGVFGSLVLTPSLPVSNEKKKKKKKTTTKNNNNKRHWLVVCKSENEYFSRLHASRDRLEYQPGHKNTVSVTIAD